MTNDLTDELLAFFLQSTSEHALIGLDAEGSIVEWTPGASCLMGYDAIEVLSRHVSTLYSPEDVEAGQPALDLAAATSVGCSIADGWRVRRDGSRFPARTLVRSRVDEGGRLAGFLKWIVDRSDQDSVLRRMVAADQHLASLIEQSFDGIVSVDENQKIILFNQGAERLFGYDRQEVLGKPLSVLIPERFGADHATHVVRFVADGHRSGRMAQGRIVQARRSDGSEIPVEASISTLGTGTGTIASVILRDASERVAYEAALVDRFQRARQLADVLPVPVLFFDADRRISFANRVQCAWFGADPADLQGALLLDVLDDLSSIEAPPESAELIEVALSGEEARFVGRIRTADGSIREIESYLVPSFEYGGQVEGVYVVTLDLTEGLRVEVARRVQEGAARLLQARADPWLTFQATVVLCAGTFADECTGYLVEMNGPVRVYSSRGGKIGEERESALDRSDLSRVVHQAWSASDVRSFGDTESRATSIAVPVPTSERPGGVLVFTWFPPFDSGRDDLETARGLGERLGGAMDRLDLELRARLALKGRDWLIQRVTHDLGSPVASIVMLLDRILKKSPDDDRRSVRPLLEGMAREAGDMRRLIEELLDAARLRTGSAVSRAMTLEVVGAVTDIVTLFEPVATSRGVRIELSVPTGPVHVRADPRHLDQCVSGLLSDACSWEGASVFIGVSVRDSEGVVSITVLGSGPSVSATSLAEVVAQGVDADSPLIDDSIRVTLPLIVAAELVSAQDSELRSVTDEGGRSGYAFDLPLAR